MYLELCVTNTPLIYLNVIKGTIVSSMCFIMSHGSEGEALDLVVKYLDKFSSCQKEKSFNAYQLAL